MEQQTARQLHGAVELWRDVTQGAVEAIGSVHDEIAAQPYKMLRRIPLLSRPAGVVEHIQHDITCLTYHSVVVIAGMLASAAVLLLQAAGSE